jgi:hypothetical protein
MLPGRLAAAGAANMALERPEKIEEGRGLLVELVVETSDPRRRLLRLWEMALGDATLHCAAPFSTVRTREVVVDVATLLLFSPLL